jgi:hypothetical protein
LSSLPCLGARFVLRLTNFINAFLVRVDCSRFARKEEPPSRGAFNGDLASDAPQLQLNLEIAQAVSQRRLSLSTTFSPGRKCVEASDDVIKDDFTSSADNRKSDFSPNAFRAPAKTTRESAKSVGRCV